MSTRNPMNERYQDEGKPAGKTRKSAASAKPATKAASSVRMETKEKPKKGLFGGKKNDTASKGGKKKNKNAPVNPKRLQHPDTPEYKKWHTVWIVLIVVAIAMTLFGLIARNLFNWGSFSIVLVVVGDAMLIGAVLIDVFLLSKMRTRYAQQVKADRSKAAKAQRAKDAAERKEALEKDVRAQDLKAVQEGKALQVEKKKKSLNPFSTKHV